MRKVIIHTCLFVLVSLVFSSSALATDPLTADAIEQKITAQHRFRKNLGQWDDNILFQGRSKSGSVYFMHNTLSFGFMRPVADDNSGFKDATHPEEERYEYMVWNLDFEGANPQPVVTSKGINYSKVNYIAGHENGLVKTAKNVPDFEEIKYENLYNGIDLRYYSSGDKLKYDYIVKAGARVNSIRMKTSGVESLRVNAKGQLEITTPWGILIEQAPYSYQVEGGMVKEVPVGFILYNDNTFGFEVRGDYNSTQELIIDPVILDWSTFVAAPQAIGLQTGYVREIKADKEEYVYGTGFYRGDRFPTTPGVYDPNFTYVDGVDMTAFKLSPDGSQLIWATFISASNGSGWGRGVGFNAAKEVFVVGYTQSAAASTFPTKNAWDNTFNGSLDFVALKLTPDGTDLVYSTFIGGGGIEMFDYTYGAGLRVDPSENVYFAGFTESGSFPMVGASYDNSYNGKKDAAIVKLDATGQVVYTTFLGSSFEDEGRGVALDAAGNLYVTGYTGDFTDDGSTPSNFPVTGGVYQSNFTAYSEVFVSKFNPAGQLVYSTLVGADRGREQGNAIQVNAAGEVYVGGFTTSRNFPTTPGAYKRTSTVGPADVSDGFVFKLNANASQLLASTFFGGNQYDYVNDIAISSTDEVFITGAIASTNFIASACAFDNTYTAGEEGFFAKLTPGLNAVEYSTLFGGQNNDYRERVEIIENGCVDKVLISLSSHSPEFPVTPGAYQGVRANDQNGVPTGQDVPTVMRFKPVVDPKFLPTPGQCGTATTFQDQSTGNCIWKFGAWTPSAWEWDFGDGTKLKSNGQAGTTAVGAADNNGGMTAGTYQNPTHKYSSPGTYNVKLVISCPKDSIIRQVVIPNPFPQPLDLGPDTTICNAANINVPLDAGSFPGCTYEWSTGATTQTITATTADTFWVSVKSGTCELRDTIIINSIQQPEVDINDTTFCEGGSATFNAANPGATYTWSTGETTQSVTVDETDTIWVEVSYGAGCTASDTAVVTVTALPTASINDTTACGAAVVLDAGAVAGATYLWSSTETTQSISVTASGEYWVEIDVNGCKARDTADVQFTPAQIEVLPHGTDVCLGDTTEFNDSSTVANDNIVSWQWVFAAGDTSVLQHPKHVYTEPGVHTATLTVVTAQGCKASATVEVEVYALPVADFTPKNTCEGNSTDFTDKSTAPAEQSIISWNWDFGTSTSTVQNPVHNFGSAGDYTVSLIVETNRGCVDTIELPFTVNPKPVAAFSPNAEGCAPVSVQFADESTGTDITYWQWDLGDGTTSNLQNPQHTYTTPGTYNVSLIVSTAARCADSIAKTAVVKVYAFPEADFDANPWKTSIFYPDIQFTDKSDNSVVGWTWDFGDESGSSSQQHPAYTYTSEGVYTVTLKVVNEFGCSDSVGKVVEITPEWSFFVPNAFTPNKNRGNEHFVGVGIGIVEHEMWVYDRWGVQIHHSPESPLDNAIPWDGTVQNSKVEAQEDVYVYVIHIVDVFNKKHKYVGHVSLIR